MYASLRVLTRAHQPPPLQELVPAIAPRSVLRIASGTSDERTINRADHEPAQQSELWELPEVGHTLGLRDRSAAYERRVTTFLDRALARS
jgi:hypothetical protein